MRNARQNAGGVLVLRGRAVESGGMRWRAALSDRQYSQFAELLASSDLVARYWVRARGAQANALDVSGVRRLAGQAGR